MKAVGGWAYPEVDDFMWREMKPDGSYQGSHLRIAMQYVTDRSLAIDGGAHVGTWSKTMSGLFDRVVSVEPSPDTFEALSVNMTTFGCVNVDLRNCALGDRAGTVSMAPLDPRAEAIKNTGARFVKFGGTIPLERIDDWKLKSCGFIKLDIEGSEPLALNGARETLKRCKPIVLFENKGFCKRFGYPSDGPHRVLKAVGYKHLTRAGKDEIWGPV